MAVMENIKIWQQNVNKSCACQHNLMSNNHLVREGINIVALQEPAIDSQGFTLAARDWTPIYPSFHRKTESNVDTYRVVVTLGSSHIDTLACDCHTHIYLPFRFL